MANVPGFESTSNRYAANGPARAVVAIVADNDNDLPDGKCMAIACGTAGTLSFIDCYGNTVTDFPLQQGYNPIMVTRVLEGGTASNLWALY